MSSKSNAVAASAEEMSSNINSVAAALEEASISITTVASAIEELTSSVNEIAQNTGKARGETGDAVGQANRVSERVEELGRTAIEIGKVTEAITEIHPAWGDQCGFCPLGYRLFFPFKNRFPLHLNIAILLDHRISPVFSFLTQVPFFFAQAPEALCPPAIYS